MLLQPQIRPIVRHLALDALATADYLREAVSGEASQAAAVQIVLLHHVRPDEERRFSALLDYLQKRYQLISYREAVERIYSGQVKAPAAAITFDDGLKNHLRAARMLAERGISGCFFVCPGIVGERDVSRVQAFCRQRLFLTQDEQFLSWDDLACMLDEGHEIGGHTMTHAKMCQLTSDALAEEVGTSYAIMKQRLGTARHFAWPFGQFFHITPEAAGCVFKHGFESCASGERGTHGPHRQRNERICIRRDNVDASWPLRHIAYFLKSSARNPIHHTASWPPGWSKDVSGRF
jgi:peptidoglycan/xylan/chitin deacetylase (PgdA/CDA1 family)